MKRILPLLLAVVFVCGCFPSLKKTFADLTYPENPRIQPPRDNKASMASALMPVLLAGYENPAAAGICYETLAGAADLFTNLETLGACLAAPSSSAASGTAGTGGSGVGGSGGGGGGGGSGVPQDHWIGCMNASATFLRSCEPALGMVAGSPADKAQAALVLATLSEVFFSYRLSTTHQTTAEPMTANDKADFVHVLGLAAKMLRCDPSNAGANGRCDLSQAPSSTTPRPRYPSLALAGGSANGAFAAGYLFALLSAREEAYRAVAGDAAKLTALLQERFGEVAGTSIGTLIALLADLYFTDIDGTTLPAGAPAARALTACLNNQPPTARATQSCALAMLESQFTTSDEWEVLCVEKGSFQDLLEDADHILRFDPLANNVITPFMNDFGEMIMLNDFIRVAMSVNFQDNTLVGLDERACRLPGMPAPPVCLGSAVLASIVLPVFVEPVRLVFSGLHGANGEPGYWLDGGVRSKTPALRAVSMASSTGLNGPRVLAINNSRAEGITRTPPDHILGVTFATMDQFAHQIQDWEMGMAALHAQVQRARACYLSQHLGYGSCTASGGSPPGGRVLMRLNRTPLGGALMPVFVPDHVPDYYSAVGYAFDPEVMTGLFFWGQKTFLASRDDILSFLGWSTVASEAATWMTTRLQQVDQTIAASYATSPPLNVQAAHLQDRNRQLLDQIGECTPH